MTSDTLPDREPTREEVDHWTGPVLLEIGASWCGYCQAIQPELRSLLRGQAEIRHVKIEDGRGKPLGRSFRVKLWPTLVFLRDGQVLYQVSRPSAEEMRTCLAKLAEATKE